MKFIIVMCVFLTGCGTICEQAGYVKEGSTQIVYVKPEVPADLLRIPEYPAKLKPNATERDKANWILETEKRVQVLENNILAIKEILFKKDSE